MLIQQLKYIELALPSRGIARFPDVQELRGKYIHSITYVPFTTGVKPYYSTTPDFDAPISTPYLLSLREIGSMSFFMKNVNVALFYNQGKLTEAVHINKILDIPNCEAFNPTNKTVGLGLTIAYGDTPVDSLVSNDYIPIRAFSQELELIAGYGTREYLGSNNIYNGKKIRGIFCNESGTIGFSGKKLAKGFNKNAFLTLMRNGNAILDRVPLRLFYVSGFSGGYVRTGAYGLDNIEFDGADSFIEILPGSNPAVPYPKGQALQLNFIYQ